MKSRLAGIRSLTLPQTAGPGQARIVIGPDLPPPLDTYTPSVPFAAATGYAGAIIFYAAGDDTTYVYAAVVDDGTAAGIAGLVIGMVTNGVVRETSPGYPDGVIWRADVSGAQDLWSNAQQAIHRAEFALTLETERGAITIDANQVAGLGGEVNILAAADMLIQVAGLGSPSLTIDALTTVMDLLTLGSGADSQIGNGYKVAGENGRVLLLMDDAEASAALGLAVAAAAVPGCSITFDTFVANTEVWITGVFDFNDIAATTSIAIGECVVDGAVQTRQALLQGEGSNNIRATVTQQWKVTLAAAGSHTISLQARATAGLAWNANAVHTCVQLMAFH